MKHQGRAASPESLGLDPAKLARLFERAEREVSEGVLPSCQLAVARHGKLAAVKTIGAANDDSTYIIFSCSKAITSAANTLNRCSPFAAEARCGQPMCPGSERSRVIQPRLAGANALPGSTGFAAP